MRDVFRLDSTRLAKTSTTGQRPAASAEPAPALAAAGYGSGRWVGTESQVRE